MGVILRVLFVLAVVVAPIVVWTTSAQLPERVASHFGNGGVANGFMGHDAYVLFMICMTTLLPLAVAGSIGFIPSIATSKLSVKNREHWLAPGRREATMATLGSVGCAIGIVLVVFLVGMHFLLLEANTRTPPRLDMPVFTAALIGFLAMTGISVAFLAIRFGSSRTR